jgi:hypothetical protein
MCFPTQARSTLYPERWQTHDGCMNIIVELILEVLFSYPGAGLRWLLHGGKKSYQSLIREDFTYNTFVFFIFLTIVFVLLNVVGCSSTLVK